MYSSSSLSLLPWFAPRLSQAMVRVLSSLGHEMRFVRGEIIYESPGFFRRLMLVRRGIVARALMDPLHEDPLLVALSGPGSLCGSCETLYLQDRMQRRHWCVTSSEVLVVNADLLLRICDQNSLWQKELSHYSAVCAVGDRLGLLITHATTLEERLGVFVIAVALSSDSSYLERFKDPSVQWVPMAILPSARVTTALMGANSSQIRQIVKEWIATDAVRWQSHKILLSRVKFSKYWERVEPILRTVDVFEPDLASKLPVRDLEIPV